MSYAQGGIIAAVDYNSFITGSNQINTIWGTGTGDAGYGQSALSTVSATSIVTATQWATLINTLNSILTHQSGGGSGISATTAGSKINYLSTLASSINTGYTNRLNFATQGSTVAGSVFSPNYTVAATTAAQTWNFTRTITFGSPDNARYFFNCGGQLSFVTTGVSNGDATSRSGDWVTLIGTNLGNKPNLGNHTSSAHTGTGGTVNADLTSTGYTDLTTTAAQLVQITSTTTGYTTDYVQLQWRSSGVNSGGNGDHGSTIYIDVTVYSDTKAYANLDSINVTWSHRIDIVYPESTNLSNSWGTPTIS